MISLFSKLLSQTLLHSLHAWDEIAKPLRINTWHVAAFSCSARARILSPAFLLRPFRTARYTGGLPLVVLSKPPGEKRAGHWLPKRSSCRRIQVPCTARRGGSAHCARLALNASQSWVESGSRPPAPRSGVECSESLDAGEHRRSSTASTSCRILAVACPHATRRSDSTLRARV